MIAKKQIARATARAVEDVTNMNTLDCIKNRISVRSFLDKDVEDEKLHITTSEAREIFVRTDRRTCLVKMANDGELFTSAEFDLKAFIKQTYDVPELADNAFIRVIVYDKAGKKAYTPAYYVKDFTK